MERQDQEENQQISLPSLRSKLSGRERLYQSLTVAQGVETLYWISLATIARNLENSQNMVLLCLGGAAVGGVVLEYAKQIVRPSINSIKEELAKRGYKD